MNDSQDPLLVVDDHDMNRDMLSRRLSRRGYTVAVAADGTQALQMIETQPFALVLLDIMMPGLSGFDVLKRLRERYSASELPVIMATAKNQSEDIVSALQLGANDYVTKPLDFPVVLARIQTQLSLKQATEEIQRLALQLERHNQFIRRTFGRYLTDEIVSSILDSPTGLRLGGERRQVTLLMADLRGFTSMAERLMPEQVVAILNRYLGAMADVITHYHGTIDEFIGDAILVLFGAPVQRPDDTSRAVACAVAMQLAIQDVNADLRQADLPEVEMGIGVHCGEVVVGNIGSDKRTKYGVVGSPVNVTGRIESYTIGGQILVSEAACQQVEPPLTLVTRLDLDAKGVEQPITVYEVRGIGAPYHLVLPPRDEALIPLSRPLALRYNVLEGKRLRATPYTGSLVTLSVRGGEISTDIPIEIWSDIKIQLLNEHGAPIPSDLYAKILRYRETSDSGFYVHFTAIPPMVAKLFQEVRAGQTSGKVL